jgi:hypothetical protein
MSIKPLVYLSVILALLTLPAHAFAQSTQKDPPAPVAPATAGEKSDSAEQANKDAAFQALVQKVKSGDMSVDFTGLRMAYAESSSYSPYGGDSNAQKALNAALLGEKWDEALKQADKVLDKNYLDSNAHFGAFVANSKKGNAEKAELHKFIVKGLLNSIQSSGDGKSMEKAFIVISVDEEYALLSFMGLRTVGHALLNDKGHSYDKMTLTDPKTNETYEFYFNVDKPFNHLGNILKK